MAATFEGLQYIGEEFRAKEGLDLLALFPANN
jgi:hypothetical protein